MNIGQAAHASGVSAKMIRYYEQTGLIPRAERLASGYRDYSATDVHRLGFVRRARALGFSVAEIEELLSLWGDRSRHSADVKRIATAHIEVLQSRIDHLNQMATTLRTLIECCAGDDRPDCPILTDLADPALARSSGARPAGSSGADPFSPAITDVVTGRRRIPRQR